MPTLVDLFLSRTPGANGSPYEAMRVRVEELRRATGFADPLARLDEYLKARLVNETKADSEIAADGFIQPLGSRYDEGFRMVLKAGIPNSRMRFTIAHELCHTFFYEAVPEVKFSGQIIDETEERLCNYGAAELLIPESDLRQRPGAEKPSITNLRLLAKEYGVSMEAMLLRLRSLKLWRCDLSIWHHKSDGSYVLDKLIGWDKHPWRWGYPERVARTWDKAGQRIIAGWGYVSYFDEERNVTLGKRVYVQSLNRGDSVLVLWSEKEFPKHKEDLPLFSRRRKRPNS